jgi:SAM-dependent methyltransferase
VRSTDETSAVTAVGEGHTIDAAAWDERYAASGLVWSNGPNQFVVDQVSDLLADRGAGRALDLAGGEGRNALWFAEQGWESELVEFSAVALEKAAAIAESRGVALRTTLADVTAEPALEPADLVLVCYLQLAAEPLARALRHAATLVAPWGTLLVIAHERDNLEHGYGGPPDAAFLPTVPDVLAAIDGQGLEVLRAEQVRRLVETDDGPREAIDLLVRAQRPAEPAQVAE